MKKISLSIALLIMLATTACNIKNSSGRQSITVKTNGSSYHFLATFPVEKSNRVFQFVEQQLHTTKLFEEDNNRNIDFDQSTKLHLLSRDGLLEIEFNKSENSDASWQKLSKLCMGIKEELGK